MVQAIIAEPINHLSRTAKLDKIRSWSLEAGDTCFGSIGAKACEGCYAKSGHYTWSNVKKA
jgi:hypothetical protein